MADWSRATPFFESRMTSVIIVGEGKRGSFFYLISFVDRLLEVGGANCLQNSSDWIDAWNRSPFKSGRASRP